MNKYIHTVACVYIGEKNGKHKIIVHKKTHTHTHNSRTYIPTVAYTRRQGVRYPRTKTTQKRKKEEKKKGSYRYFASASSSVRPYSTHALSRAGSFTWMNP